LQNLTGKLTGNFADSGLYVPFLALKFERVQWFALEFPTESEQGISEAVAGKLFAKTGNYFLGLELSGTQGPT
jgi:hypothetical protein